MIDDADGEEHGEEDAGDGAGDRRRCPAFDLDGYFGESGIRLAASFADT